MIIQWEYGEFAQIQDFYGISTGLNWSCVLVAGYVVYVDWNNDGDFSDANEDITSDVKFIRISRGRDDDLDKAEVGKCTIVCHDGSAKYVPENTSSPLYGNLLPARPVEVKYGSDTLFYGFLDDILPNPDRNRKEATLLCVDGFDQLKRAKVTVALQTSQKSGQLYTTALDTVSWSATNRTLDAGIDTYPLVHAEKQSCLDFLQKIEKSEFGFCYISHDGKLTWEDRHHRLKSPHTTSQWTATASDYRQIKPTESLKGVRNKVLLSAQPKTKAGSLSTIWTLQENATNGDSPLITAGETKTYFAEYADANGIPNIAGDVVDPLVASTDYTGNAAIDGSGADRTSDVSVTITVFAASAKLEVENTSGTSLYLTSLQVRGKIYTDQPRLRVEAEDSTSQTAYLERDLSVELPYYQNAATMQSIADHYLYIKKVPITGYIIELANADDTIWTQIVTRKLSDRITLQNSDLNIDADFFIDKMKHEISKSGTLHKCWWTLSRADVQAYWIIGTSILGTSTRLAY